MLAVQGDVSAFLEHLRTHGIDSRSSARKLSCLRGFYKWLLLDRRIHHDPTVNIESPKTWKVLPKSLAEPEVAEMLDRAGHDRFASPGPGYGAARPEPFLNCCMGVGFGYQRWPGFQPATSGLMLAACRCVAKATRNGLCLWVEPPSRQSKNI